MKFPPANPELCGLQNCKCFWQGNTPSFTLALYCENKSLPKDQSYTACAYMFSCGRVVHGTIEILPTDQLSTTVRKAAHSLYPMMVNLTHNESKADGTVWH